MMFMFNIKFPVMRKIFMAALALACTVLIGGGCSKDETGGSISLGDLSYSVTSAVAVYALDEDSEGNPVTYYEVYFMMDGLTLDALMAGTVSEGAGLVMALEFPGETYEFPKGTYVAGEDPVFLGAVFDVISEAGSDSQEITECTLTIGRSGKNYTFRISGETEDGQPVSFRYTGPVQFVDFDSMM